MTASSPSGVYQALSRAGDDADGPLRPRSFSEFVGQRRVVTNLTTWIEAAQRRGGVLDHVLLSGGPGLGKTTLAHLLADALGAQLKVTSGPALEKPGDLVGLLTGLEQGDVLFVDEIHRLSRTVEEYLYAAMEDRAVDVVIDAGPAARSVRLTLHPFTLVGATTREGLLSHPLRSRFGVVEKLEPYPEADIERILVRSAERLGCGLDPEAATEVSRRARGVPRVANRLLRRLRDVADLDNAGRINLEVVGRGLAMMGIDERGLEDTDRRILDVLRRQGGGPVGLKTIAVAVGEEEDTVEQVYEPYLIRLGLVLKTSRGRELAPELRREGGGAAAGLFES